LQILLAAENRVVVQVTIPEGLQLVEIVSVLVTDLGLSERQAAGGYRSSKR